MLTVNQVNHENVIEFVDYMEDHKFCYCFTKLHGTGWSYSEIAGKRSAMDLFECIEQSDHFTEPMARHIFSQISDAVAHIHGLGLAHRDIKDENILIDQDFNVKLIDFGSAAFVNPDRPFDLFLGTKQYASPEILRRHPYCGFAADIWSLGCCLYIILTGAVPFSSGTQAIQYPFTPPNRDISDSCLNLLERMLEKDTAKRIKIEDIRNHPWLTMNHLPVSHL